MIRTERLLLRRWRSGDREPFARMNADPSVMQHFPSPLGRAESDAYAAHIDAGFDRDGFGLWALEIPGEAAFIGFTGLTRVRSDMPFAPAVEVGWRLATPFWGRGLASEAARAAVARGFALHGLREIVAYTYEGNTRSRGVMERLGMSHEASEDFAHPALAAHDRLSRHVLYRLRAPDRSCG